MLASQRSAAQVARAARPAKNVEIAIGRDCVPRAVRSGEAIVTLVWKNRSPRLGASFSSLDERHFCTLGAAAGGTYRFAVPPAGRGFALYAYLPRGKWILYEDRYRCEAGGRLTITLDTRVRLDGTLAFKASYDATEKCKGGRGFTASAHATFDRESGMMEPPLDIPCCSEKAVLDDGGDI